MMSVVLLLNTDCVGFTELTVIHNTSSTAKAAPIFFVLKLINKYNNL